MRRRAIVIAMLSTIALHARATDAPIGSLTIVRNERDPVCQEARKILEAITPRDFWNGKWREAFGAVAWVQGTWPTITAQNTQENVPFKYLEADMDADGAPEVAVVWSGMIRSVQFDWLYLFDPGNFRSARESGGISAALNHASQLNPANLVLFSNGEDAIPVDLQLWQRDQEMLLLLKEYNFARAGQRVTNAFVVARIDRTSLTISTPAGDAKRLRPAMICRFVQR
jgi:hypothetical protein